MGIYHGNQTWFDTRSNLTLAIKDGQIEIKFSSIEHLVMNFTEPSIKKTDLSYMLVSGGWGGGGYWTITGKRRSPGFFVKEENKTIFTKQIPKERCEDYLTLQIVKELFPSSRRDYTEVIKSNESQLTSVKIFEEKPQFESFTKLVNPDEELSGYIFDPVEVDVYFQVVFPDYLALRLS